MTRTLSALMLVAAFHASAQTTDPPRFEVASVKANGADDSNVKMVGIRTDGAQFNSYSSTLKRLLMYAYGVKSYQISGPQWIEKEMYTIAATLPPGATREQVPVMLQQLLRDRFHLELGRQSKEMPLYELTTAKSGFKLKPSESSNSGGAPPAPTGGAQPAATAGGGGMARVAQAGEGSAPRVAGYHKMNVKRITIARLASLIELWLDRPVKDTTGIAGEFDLAIEFTTGDSVPEVPSIFTALPEQTGLKLEAKKGPVDVLVIERVDRTPVEN